MTREPIVERLRNGEMLLLDGGTGSELQRRGADVLKDAEDRLKAWSATANIEYADVVRQVHSDYLRVGADIIISNNFWTTPTRLERIGERDNWRTYATAAIRNAVQARDAMNPDAYVAGGIAAPSLQGGLPPAHSPVSDTQQLGVETYRKEWSDHAKLLADEGADVMLAGIRRVHRGLRCRRGRLRGGGAAGLTRSAAHHGRRHDELRREPGRPCDRARRPPGRRRPDHVQQPGEYFQGTSDPKGGVCWTGRGLSQHRLQSDGPHRKRAHAHEPEAERGRGHPSRMPITIPRVSWSLPENGRTWGPRSSAVAVPRARSTSRPCVR